MFTPRNFFGLLKRGKMSFRRGSVRSRCKEQEGDFRHVIKSLKRGAKITSFRFRGGLNPPRSWAVGHEGQRFLRASLFVIRVVFGWVRALRETFVQATQLCRWSRFPPSL